MIKDIPVEKGTGTNSVVQKGGSTATGELSFAEGAHTKAYGGYSHAEGFDTTALGHNSHAEGAYTKALGNYSHTEGNSTTASGGYSHAEGLDTTASNDSEHAEGKYNLSIQDKTIHTVGIGESNEARKNAEEIHTDGRKFIIGIGSYDGTNSTTESTKSVQEVISNLVDRIKALEDALSQSSPSQV